MNKTEPDVMPLLLSVEEQALNQYRAMVRDLDGENISMRLYLARMRALDFWLLDELVASEQKENHEKA